MWLLLFCRMAAVCYIALLLVLGGTSCYGDEDAQRSKKNFYAWGGKRPFSSWGGKRDVGEPDAITDDKRAFPTLCHKIALSNWGEKRQGYGFNSWGGKRDVGESDTMADDKRAFTSLCDKFALSNWGEKRKVNGFHSWGGKRNALPDGTFDSPILGSLEGKGSIRQSPYDDDDDMNSIYPIIFKRGWTFAGSRRSDPIKTRTGPNFNAWGG